jgi:TRAP-type C4-dicarboxylate transport system permease small subunit
MNAIQNGVNWLAKYMEMVAGFFLVFMVAITTVDVIGRAFNRPIPGTYEIVAFAGGLVLGFALPITAYTRGMICVDALFVRFSKSGQRAMHICTRLASLGIFILCGWNLMKMGSDMRQAGEVSLTLELPIWTIPYGISFAVAILCVVLIADMFREPPSGEVA